MENWKKFKKTRWFHYSMGMIICFAFWKIFGFEEAVIIALGQIFGELIFQHESKH